MAHITKGHFQSGQNFTQKRPALEAALDALWRRRRWVGIALGGAASLGLHVALLTGFEQVAQRGGSGTEAQPVATSLASLDRLTAKPVRHVTLPSVVIVGRRPSANSNLAYRFDGYEAGALATLPPSNASSSPQPETSAALMAESKRSSHQVELINR